MHQAASVSSKPVTIKPRARSVAAVHLTVQPCANEHEAEVLAFLATHAIHNVIMTDFIRVNALVSPANRGTFYVCRNARGGLEGVALIGHLTLFHAGSEAALAALARLARDCPFINLIMGEEKKVECFWNYFAEAGHTPRLISRELLLEQRWPVDGHEMVPGLRQATPDDLVHVMAAQAEVLWQETGVNPLETDPVGFRLRTMRRIEQERVWVWIEGGRLIFKADIAADTPAAIYLEGVYVTPGERRKGYGTRCFVQLSRILLARTKAICLLVNEQNLRAQNLYRRVGYEHQSYYRMIFLQRRGD